MRGYVRAAIPIYGLILGFVLIIVSAVLSYRSVERFAKRADMVQHSHIVLNQINLFLSELKDAETGARGYLLTHDPSFLAPYTQAEYILPAQLEKLESLTRDNPDEQRTLSSLKQLTAQQLTILRSGIALTKQDAPNTKAQIVAFAQHGKSVMNETRAIVGTMVAQEEQTLARRTAAENIDASTTKRWIVLGSLAAMALLFYAFQTLQREIRSRIAAQKHAEQTADALSDLYNNAPCAYHSVDDRGVITRINDTELAWLGYTREEVVGNMRHDELMTPESAERYRQEALPRFLAQGELKDVEFDYVRKDGSIFCGALNKTAIRDGQGRYLTSRSSLYDITDRKQAELRIRQLNTQLDQRAAELEMSNKELESFSYSVSHDLRSPLRAIDGYSRMLEEDYAEQIDAEGRRILQVIRDNSKKMGRLIDDLLAFSRLGRKPVEAACIDMDALVDEVWAQAVALDQPPATAVRLQKQALPPAWGDLAMIRQVLANLISNAIKYSSRQAQAVVEISATPGDAETAYHVRDNGVGFDMQYYNKLFRVFQRLHSASEFPGTGVGLAIVQRVVVRHGGRVWAQSTPGTGSIFTFSLPTKETP